ncbi:TRAP transporter substrate-binding protein [Acuticoccus sp. M5D2P5]|uniref:TRAP transporter substrate-binding protein n=1 Tax=Acuticoccus kalidii TaxID=2910977 RepID=UPI001F2843E2|nr:TRAP transporter substrate-binding protein [Acuticoccus kalidii]MCF3934495.1 TRAP transporter substrate-binding protein [Acuticoccus kalidii]
MTKRKMQIRLGLTGTALAVLVGAVAAAPVAEAAEKTIRVSYETPDAHIKSRTIVAFKEEIEKISDGYFEVELYPAAQLLGPSEEVAATARGQIEMSAPYFSYIAPVEPLMNIYQAPLVFDSYDQLIKFLETDEAKALAEKLEARNLESTGYWFENPTRLWGKEPLRTIDDLKGKKIRTVPSEILQGAVAAMGAQPTAIPGTELYLALQQGVADGAFTAPNYGLTMKYYEVTDAVTKLDLFYGGYLVLFNKRWYDALPEERQAQLVEAVAAARAFNEENVKADLEKVDEDLRAVGQEVIELSPEALADFRAALAPYYETLDPEIQEMIKQVQGL